MTFTEFSLSKSFPNNLDEPLQALWEAKQGHWEKAHNLVHKLTTEDAAWVHAWLHRQEGDNSNANYWYVRAKKNPCAGNLDEEWESIAKKLLGTFE